MTSDELAYEIGEAIRATTERVLGVGKEQYDLGNKQKFETLELGELLTWTLEELDDLLVYNVMLRIRLRRIEAALKAVENGKKEPNVVESGPITAFPGGLPEQRKALDNVIKSRQSQPWRYPSPADTNYVHIYKGYSGL